MDIETLSQIVGGNFINVGKITKINEIKIDSREINKGDIFIALIGANTDGHNYIEEVIRKKPSAIIVCKKTNIKTKVPIILVEDTYNALIKIGAYFRNKYNIPVIGVTGSVGKTTTKEIISDILSKKYKILKSEKNYNNHIGVPLTLTKLTDKHDICVIEMGMNHIGEISKLSKLIKPNIAVITNIGTAHIGNLGSKKNILKAKMEIIDGMKKGVLILNNKDRLLKKVKSPYLLKNEQKLIPYDIKVDDKVSFKLKIDNKIHSFNYNGLNKNLVMNFVIAIQIGLLFGIPIDDIKNTISNYKMPKDRMNVIVKGTTTIIDDCYNASLESVKSSIDVLKNFNNNKIVILGDLLELGKHTIKIHKKIGKQLKKVKNIEVLLVGENVKYIKGKKYKYFNDNGQLIKYLKTRSLNNTTILIKGSRKMHLEEITEYLVNSDI